MKLSKPVTIFKCDTFEKTFHDQSTLNFHKKVHTFVCKTCDKVFTSKDNLNEHTRYHNEKTGMDKIKQNVVQANELEDENEISITKIAFNTEELFTKKSNLLVENVATNLPVRVNLQNTEGQFMKESNFLVKQCGKEFTRQGNLAQQRRTAHEGVKFPCGQCGKQFTSKGSLARHRRSVHERIQALLELSGYTIYNVDRIE